MYQPELARSTGRSPFGQCNATTHVYQIFHFLQLQLWHNVVRLGVNFTSCIEHVESSTSALSNYTLSLGKVVVRRHSDVPVLQLLLFAI